ncbi:MAG: hypothetical protein Q9222_003559 [Ikaeria aurantiellina]
MATSRQATIPPPDVIYKIKPDGTKFLDVPEETIEEYPAKLPRHIWERWVSGDGVPVGKEGAKNVARNEYQHWAVFDDYPISDELTPKELDAWLASMPKYVRLTDWWVWKLHFVLDDIAKAPHWKSRLDYYADMGTKRKIKKSRIPCGRPAVVQEADGKYAYVVINGNQELSGDDAARFGYAKFSKEEAISTSVFTLGRNSYFKNHIPTPRSLQGVNSTAIRMFASDDTMPVGGYCIKFLNSSEKWIKYTSAINVKFPPPPPTKLTLQTDTSGTPSLAQKRAGPPSESSGDEDGAGTSDQQANPPLATASRAQPFRSGSKKPRNAGVFNPLGPLVVPPLPSREGSLAPPNTHSVSSMLSSLREFGALGKRGQRAQIHQPASRALSNNEKHLVIQRLKVQQIALWHLDGIVYTMLKPHIDEMIEIQRLAQPTKQQEERYNDLSAHVQSIHKLQEDALEDLDPESKAAITEHSDDHSLTSTMAIVAAADKLDFTKGNFLA